MNNDKLLVKVNQTCLPSKLFLFWMAEAGVMFRSNEMLSDYVLGGWGGRSNV